MRRLLIVFALCLLSATPALAKPKIVVTPLAGDADDKVGEVLRDALGDKLDVVGAKEVERAMDKLGVSGALDEKAVKKLQDKLGTAVVVHGKVGRTGKKKSLKLIVSVRGKPADDFTVQYKSVASDGFRTGVRDAVLKKIGDLDDLEDAEKPKKKRLADKEPEPEVEKPKKKKVAEADAEVSGEADRPKKRKKKKRSVDGDGEGVSERPQNTQIIVAGRVDAGLSVGLRRLTYTVGADSTTPPPKVSTGAGAGRIEVELYPFALSNKRSALAGLGLVADYDKTFGLSIDIPNSTASTPINQSHFSIGAQYRIPAGKGAVAFGLRYQGRHYIADRSGLTMPNQLDAPDVDYSAIAPAFELRFPVAPKVVLFAGLDAMLVLSTGAIQAAENYGAATVYGVEGAAGVDIALAKQFALHIAAEYSQINLSFKGTGTMAGIRKVSAATDRSMGLAATLAAFF